MERMGFVRIREAGLSLVEVMVALVVGLITVLVVMQVFTAFEGDKRTTMGVSDAQTSGSIALYTIRRQVLVAGYGLPVFTSQNTVLQCAQDFAVGGANLFPVEIVDGGNGSDTVRVRYGSSPLAGIHTTITGVAGNVVGVDNNQACANGDSALLVTAAACATTSVTAIPASPDTTHITLGAIPAGIIPNKTVLACLGQWTQFAYFVNNDRLEVATTVNGVTTTAPVMADIVSLQAQYGISATAGENVIRQWVDATGVWANLNDDPADVARRNRIKAIRVAVVARSGLREREDVTATCSSQINADPTGLCAWEGVPVGGTITTASPAPAINLNPANDPNSDWQRYRYRVYETIIPLRNIVWNRSSLG